MARYSLLLLALATCGRSWPQLSLDEDVIGRRTAQPDIPYTAQGISPRQLPVIDTLDASVVTLPVPRKKKKTQSRSVESRQLPVIDDVSSSLATLPVPRRKGKVASRQFPEEDFLGSTITLPVPQLRPPIASRDSGGDAAGVVRLPVIRSTRPGLSRRAIEVPLANRSDVAYYAQLNIGTPPQPVFVQLDTGSFELWVNPDCTVLSPGDMRFCQAVGIYNRDSSSTASQFSGEKTLRYGIGTANITYVRDDIGLPGSQSIMKAVQFGVATSTEDQFAGILGIGYGQGVTTRYRNFVDELAAQGVTRTRAFSLALGSKDDQEGVIVFGGIDTAKFSGALAQLPIIPAAQAPDGVARYWVQMNSISLTPPSGRTRAYPNSTLAVFLDSGATLTLLPLPLADTIAADFGATAGLDQSGFYPVDCMFLNVNGTVDFAFNGITIKVPYREMVREIRVAPNGGQPRTQCYLGIVPSEDFVLLGDTFLRSAYVVFDPDGNKTYMAAYNNCGSQVVSIDNVNLLPSFTGLCSVIEGASVAGPPGNGGGQPGIGGAGQNAADRLGPAAWVPAVILVSTVLAAIF